MIHQMYINTRCLLELFLKTSACLLLLLGFKIELLAQSPIICDTDIILDSLELYDSEYSKKRKLYEAEYRNFVLGFRKNSTVVDTLPIVVHIIHDGHPIGSDENPTDAEIIQKINQVNDRFRHINQTNGPNPFSNADTEINVCLAELDTLGNYTTGIIRHDDSLTYNTPSQLSAALEIYKWDTDKYLNVFEIEYISGAIGRFYGGQDVVAVRTGTSSWLLAHEIGHYFSLKHTFQGACVNDDCLDDGDSVCDTPPKAFDGISGSCGNPGNSCTTDEDDTSTNNPYRPVSMGGLGDQNDILQNYMDYTEGCGGSYTEGQKVRMKSNIALERQTNVAHASIACNIGYTPALDAAIIDITFDNIVCQDTFFPSVQLVNYGLDNLTAAVIEYHIGTTLIHTENWSGNLATGQSEWINVSNPFIIPNGRHKFYVSVSSPNGGLDEFANNDIMSRYVTYYGVAFDLPYSEPMMEFAFPEHWQISNNIMKWYMHGYSGLDPCQSDDRLLAYNGTSSSGSAFIELPPLDISEYSSINFSFDIGYIPHSATYPDTLVIETLDSCGIPVSVWEINGFAMATNDPPEYGNAYVYPTCDDMDHISFSVPSVACQNHTSFRIRVNGWARTPLILDNINILAETPCVPEGCTYLLSPSLFETNVLPDASLTWEPVASADGYYIDIGLHSNGTELLDHFDAGNTTSLNPPIIFPCDTTIYVTIVPYANGVEQMGCYSQSFTSYSLPLCEPTFSVVNIGSAVRPEAVTASDLDGDGDNDIVSAEYLNREFAWWENDGNQSFTKHVLDTDFGGGGYIEIVDMDGDMDVDILGISRFSSQVAWWENDGFGVFTKHIIDNSVGEGFNVRSGDFDNDNDIDVVAVVRNPYKLYYYENDGSGNYSRVLIDDSLTSGKALDVAYVNGDNYLDVISAGQTADEVAWFENDGSANFTKHTIDNALDGANFVDAADINGDGAMDIAATGSVADQVVWYENDGNQNFTKYIVDTYLNGAGGIFVKDIDLDGDEDVLASSPSSVNLAWYENDGSQNFSRKVLSSSYSWVSTFFPADMDNNGTIDIVVPFRSADEISVLTSDCLPQVETYLTEPVENSSDVSIATSIEWYDNINFDGYFLAIGLSSFSENIMSMQDIGNVSSFDLPEPLPTNTEIFVTILPYDVNNTILHCYQGSFVTESCIPNLIFNNTVVDDGIYLGSGQLILQGTSLNSPANASFYSDTEISILPSFSMDLGDFFEIKIRSCNDQ